MTNSFMFPSHLIFDSVFDDFLRAIPEGRRIPQTGFPVIDHYNDDDGNAILDFALAGYKVEDLNISVEGSNLTVSSSGSSNENKGIRRIAKRSFKNTFTDKENLFDLNSLQASLIDGILKIIIPKKEEAKAKSFPILTKALKS